jgi:uncharacterized membrane protein YphA (DoxX/SURF4 family)
MTEPPQTPRATPARDLFPTLARWVVGGAFVYMGIRKILDFETFQLVDPSVFLKLINEYHFTANYLITNPIAAGLPWFEVFCGLLLLAGVAVRGTALVVLSMLLPFTFVIVKRGLLVSAQQHLSFCQVQFDCGCGGGEIPICPKILSNTALVVLSACLVAGRGRKFALRYFVLRPSPLASAPSQA